MECVKHYFCMFNVVLLLMDDGGVDAGDKKTGGVTMTTFDR